MTDKNQILFYEGKWYMFSNFSSFAVYYQGETWMTAEHAYQAAKFESAQIRVFIRKAMSAYEAKVTAHKFADQVRSDWEVKKLEVMERIIRAKFDQHEYVRNKLRQTGGAEIVENSPKDSFWGRGPDWQGENRLGKIWMKVRSEHFA